MARPAGMVELPSELLLHLASHLRAEEPSQLVHLCNLCLVSRKLLPVAQEVLYANATLPIACSCHPTVNAALQLLRTLLEQPRLAVHVKSLHFSVVRRDIRKLYKDEFPKKQFNLAALLKLCLRKLAEFGYSEEHPWWASLKNGIESAYVGLLLCVLPNLASLQYTIKELHRGHGVVESVAALFGTNLLPDALGVETTLRKLRMSDLSFLRSMAFDNLRVLNINSVAVPTLLQLNGPNTFRGTSRLSELSIGLSVFLMDKACVEEMTVSFRDLIDALGCHSLSTLKVRLEHETYCTFHTPPVFDVQFFIDQLSSMESSLKVLAIEFDIQEDPAEWEFILDHCENQLSSLANFTNMESLKIPQDFFFTTKENDPKTMLDNFPQCLQRLEVVCPNRMIVDWAKCFTNVPASSPYKGQKLQEIVLHCRDDVRSPSFVFTRRVKSVWSKLNQSHQIATYVYDIDDNVTQSLPVLYKDDPGASDDDDDDDVWNSEEDDDEEEQEGDNHDVLDERSSETDEDMPDLEHFDDHNSSGMIVDDVD